VGGILAGELWNSILCSSYSGSTTKDKKVLSFLSFVFVFVGVSLLGFFVLYLYDL